MPILSRKSIHSERNCSTVNIPFLECRIKSIINVSYWQYLSIKMVQLDVLNRILVCEFCGVHHVMKIDMQVVTDSQKAAFQIGLSLIDLSLLNTLCLTNLHEIETRLFENQL